MVTGDVVAHGDWYNIEQEECLEVLKAGVPEAIYKWITNGKKRFLYMYNIDHIPHIYFICTHCLFE